MADKPGRSRSKCPTNVDASRCEWAADPPLPHVRIREPFASAPKERKPRPKLLRQYELIDRVKSYDPTADEALLNRAYVYGMRMHGSQMRASGDPYFSHPIEVAGILTDLHLDDETIATAILHDTIEDTVATPEQIRKLFCDNVARMVDGVPLPRSQQV